MKKIIWLIQSNQITPVINEYLKTLQTRVEKYIDLCFFVPQTSSEILDKIKLLRPTLFQTTTQTTGSSYPAYLAKRTALNQASFTRGASFADVLLLDDLGGGRAMRTTVELDLPDQTCGLILQIPSPLGSSDTEERTFQAAILWARQNSIPVIGYELLPLDTQWTLAASLTDGVITRHRETYDHLKAQLGHENIWLIPGYEASIFTSNATRFHLNGAKAGYHFKNQHRIPADRTVLYLPHNVAMNHEYKRLIKAMAPLGKKLHLMFSIGKDQIRGSYFQQDMIELIYRDELERFASFSFHEMNNTWEMMMADAVVGCAAGFNTMVAEKELPCIIFDPDMPEMSRGNKKRVHTQTDLLSRIEEKIKNHQTIHELADILMMLTQTGKENG